MGEAEIVGLGTRGGGRLQVVGRLRGGRPRCCWMETKVLLGGWGGDHVLLGESVELAMLGGSVGW